MIKTLHISNYALIAELDIEFAPGFNIITGETGAGKSIILGALSLLLGGRADLRAVRDASRKSVIEAVFGYASAPAVAAAIAANELDGAEGNECILRRELLPGGRSRAFVNDTPVTLGVLREIALHLVDIHSQHQNLLLASTDYQLTVIDTLADTSDLLEEYGKAYKAYKAALKNYTDTRELIRRNQADADYIAYQYQQLDSMNLQPGESESLERERELLANLGEIKSKIRLAADPLSDSPQNALAMLRHAVGAL
ncbi:MAG: AAA family ATPase, partial [Muribaculaceae bacterium]|nr:AAA family ATPase [Muribaculaceae bacterium]